MNRTEQMLSLVSDYRRTGMTQKEFCKEAGVSLAKLNYWIARSRKMLELPGFVPLGSIAVREIRLEYPSGVRIALDSSYLPLIAQLVKL